MKGTICRHRVMTWPLLVIAVSVLSLLTPGVSAAASTPKLSVVVRGNDGEVYMRTYLQGGSWGDWKPQGRPSVGVVGGPAIVYRDYGTRIIFARGGDNALWYKITGDNAWYRAGKPNGRDLAFDPDATSWGNGMAVVFVTTTDGLVYYASFSQGATLTWLGAGAPDGSATSGPSVLSWSDSDGLHMRVFVRDQAGALRSFLYSHNAWQPGDWDNHQGYIRLSTSPEVTIWSNLHRDAFVIGGDDMLYEKTFHGSWGDWRSLNGYVVGSPGAAALDDRIDVFRRGIDNALYKKTCRWRDGETVTCQEEDGNKWDYLDGGLTSDPDADWIR